MAEGQQQDLRRPLLAEERVEVVGEAPQAPPPQWQFAQGEQAAVAAPNAEDADSWLYDESVANQPGCSAAAATLNLCTTIIGSGIMALPHVFKTLGVLPASAALFTVAGLTHKTINMLVRGTVLSNKSSFGGLVEYTSGTAAMVTTRISVILNNLGAHVVFLIIIGDVLAGKPGSDASGLLTPLGGRFTQRWFDVGLLLLFVLFPLCCLKSVDSLKFTSLLSVLMSALLITITLGVMGDRILDHTLDHVNWLPAPDAKIDDLINAVPMLTTAYVCHYNVHPIFSAMRNPSAGRMGQVVTSGVLTTSIIYWLFAFAAYALFGDKTQGDVLMNYGTDLGVEHARFVERAVKAGYALSLTCTFPLLMFSLKEHLFSIFGWGEPAKRVWLSCLTSFGLLAAEFALSIAVPNITVAFGVIGSTVAVLIGFVIPAWVAIGGRQPGVAGWALLVGGILTGVVCFSSTVYGIFFSPDGLLESFAQRSTALLSFAGRR